MRKAIWVRASKTDEGGQRQNDNGYELWRASIKMTMDTTEDGMMVILMTTNTNEGGHPSSM